MDKQAKDFVQGWENYKADKQKQIEEVVLSVYPWLKEVPIEERKQLQENVSGLMVMEHLYNAGYRKIPENAVVLTREEYDELTLTKQSIFDLLEERENKTRKNFAERLKEDISQYFPNLTREFVFKRIDEICKELEGENGSR